jgi:rsbT co-antagonist protein RsbR
MADQDTSQEEMTLLRQRVADLEAQLAEMQQQLAMQAPLVRLLEATSDYVAVADPKGRFLYMNKAGAQMVGFPPDEDITQFGIPDIVAEEILQGGELGRSIEGALRDGIYQGETVLLHRDGHKTPGSLVLIGQRSSDGTPNYFAAIIRDITQQKQAEAVFQKNAAQAEMIRQQADALRELSTPLIPLSDQIVIMPLVGMIDSTRAQQILETLLNGIVEHQAEVVLLDITGVSIIDTQVANALIQAARAVMLLGAQVILTGIRPEVAQTLVGLGIDLSQITTQSSLQTGIAFAQKVLTMITPHHDEPYRL